MASPAGRGAQVILTGTQQSAARGVVGPEITVNLETKRVLEFAGTVADGTTLDGSTKTGLPAVDVGVVALGVPTLSASSLAEQSLPGQAIGLLVGLTTGSRRHLAANAGGRVALSGGEDRLVVGTTASVAADGALKVVLRETLGIQVRDTILIVTVAAYDSATTALLAAITSAPAANIAGAYDRYIRRMKAAGLWDKADVIYMPGHDDQTSRLNWKLPGTYTGTKTGTVTFEAFKGFTSDGSTGYISTGWNPLTNGVNYQQNSATLAWHVGTNINSGAFDVGASSGQMQASSRGATITGRLNASSTQSLQSVSISTGLSAMVRRSATEVRSSKDGGATTAFASTSATVASGTFRICGNISSTYSSRQVGFVFVGGALSDAELLALSDTLEAYQREVGSYIADVIWRLSPISLSTDSTAWGTMSSQQIPAVAAVGTRRFRANYGVHGLAAGTSGEVSPCYVRVTYSDNDGQTYNFGAAWLPDAANVGACIDPHMLALPDGRLLLTFPYTASSMTRWTYACVLTNPLDAPASWVWAGPYTLSAGFVGAMYLDGPDIMYTASQPATPPYTIKWQGNNFGRIRMCGNIAVHVPGGRIPDAAADGSLNSFYETSMARRADGSILAIFRTQSTGYNYYSISTDNGATWSASAPYTAVTSPTTKAWLGRSPNGNLFVIHNNGTVRERLTLTLLASDGMSVVSSFEIDSRGSAQPRVSYPDGAFSGTGQDVKILIDWDCGRGVQDAPTYTNELLAATVPEVGMLTGVPTKTTYTVTS